MRALIWLILNLSLLYSQEILLPKHIYQYLNKDNPFYYQAIGEQYVAKGRERFYKGSLDTQINLNMTIKTILKQLVYMKE